MVGGAIWGTFAPTTGRTTTRGSRHVSAPCGGERAVIGAATVDAFGWLRILLILFGAVLASRIVPRLVRRLVRRLLDSQMQRKLAVLRAHAPRALVDSRPVPAIRYSQRADAIGTLFRHLSSAVIWLTAVVLILHELDVSLATLVTGAGFLGLAVAFGAQHVIRDYLAGVFILLDDRYGVGDRVEAGSLIGDVEEVSVRWTRIRDLEGTDWYVPNGRMEEVGNHSQHRGKAVVDVPVPVQLPLMAAVERITRAIEGLRDDEVVGAWVLEDPHVLGVEAMSAETATVRVAVLTQRLKQAEVARTLRARIRVALEPGAAESP